MSLFDRAKRTQTNNANSSGTLFFSPAIQRQEAEPQESDAKEDENCKRFFSDVKDLTWAAAKHYLETRESSLFTPVPVKFEDCFQTDRAGGCSISLKNGDRMGVWYNKNNIHVTKYPQGGGKEHRCRYTFACDEKGNISFSGEKCE